MKFIFKKNLKEAPKEALFVSVCHTNKDEIFLENGIKTLYLKRDELEKFQSNTKNLRRLYLLIRKMVILAKQTQVKQLAFNFNDFAILLSSTKKTEVTPPLANGGVTSVFSSTLELAEIIGTQIAFANYEFVQYKTPPPEGFNFIKEIFIEGTNPEIQKIILKGNIIAEEVNKTRSLSNTPGGDMTPSVLAQEAKKALKNLPVKVKILGEKEMAKEKMEAILAVGRGSEMESKFIILEYWGDKKGEEKKDKSDFPPAGGKVGLPSFLTKNAPIVLVGKGVTFDSGGINLKPSSSLLGMNMDMSGGAAVIHTMALIAKNKIKKNVIGLIPAVENMPSGKSYRPGDVIRSMSGQTIEILNTDAEGRVILADALTYAEKYKPSLVIDIATLTGAAVVALGERASAIFTDDDILCKNFEEIGEETGEYLWRLPLWEEYESEIKGSLGDWTNCHNKDSRYGGATNGAIFLKQFTKKYSKDCKWVHLDIAPRMTSIAGEYLAPGALGTPVRLLYKIIEKLK
ncbi:MAG: leucyl aminopeptidase [Patescibacteria group bacterium]